MGFFDGFLQWVLRSSGLRVNLSPSVHFPGCIFVTVFSFPTEDTPPKLRKDKMNKPKHGDPRSKYMFQSVLVGVEITKPDFEFGIDRSYRSHSRVNSEVLFASSPPHVPQMIECGECTYFFNLVEVKSNYLRTVESSWLAFHSPQKIIKCRGE